ncbi:transcriptional repressor LexA [bacterium]|nr:transcriptional repressor LexA [bacterium]
MAKPLTDRQREVLDFIGSHVADRGYPPSIREIGKEFDIKSTNGVRGILQALERKGEIRRSPQLSRGIELIHPEARNVKFTAPLVEIPIIGSVAAGHPLLAEQNIEGTITLDRDLLKGDNTFALRVKGDSMVGAGIFDGDLVFAREDSDIRRGDIVVALIDNDATVKYYYPDNGTIRLEPANRFYGPIVVDQNTPGFHLAGKVVGVFRRV